MTSPAARRGGLSFSRLSNGSTYTGSSPRPSSRPSPRPSPRILHSNTPEAQYRAPPDTTVSFGQDLDAVDDLDNELQVTSDDMVEVIMAIDMKDNGTVGCAYHVASEESCYLLEDVVMGGLEVVSLLLAHAEPTTVLVSTRTHDNLISHLSARASQGDNLDADPSPDRDLGQGPAQGPDPDPAIGRGAYIIRQLGGAEFSYDSGLERLLSVIPLHTSRSRSQAVHLSSVFDAAADANEDQSFDRQGRVLKLGAFVNLDSMLSIGCASAVLGDLQRRRAAQYLPGDSDGLAAFPVRKLEMISLSDFMFVNADTLAALQVFSSESHPNIQMSGPEKPGGKSKENLSLYGLFARQACTPQGKTKLRQMFLRPSVNLETIQERHRTISVLLRPENNEALGIIARGLRKVSNMRNTVLHLRKGIESPAGSGSNMRNGLWAIFQRFASVFLELLEHVQHLAGWEQLSMLPVAMSKVPRQSLVQVGELIGRTIDFQQSRDRQRTAVATGVDDNLDAMKRNYDGMEPLLTEAATRMNEEIPHWAHEYVENCIFFPQIGFLTVVVMDHATGKGRYEGEGVDSPVWERMFATEGNVYYKNQRMKELDSHFGDMYCSILDREIEILHQLSISVLGHADAIISASDVCGDLDSYVALALAAEHYQLNAPRVTKERVLDIREGRHPLQALAVPSFVPNDCSMGHSSGRHGGGGDKPRGGPLMMVLSGPNHSGKSVYLKQVGIIVYLAHIGSYVPAENAIIGLTDRILTRMSTRESVYRDESAFATDLRQAAFLTNFATPSSLVLIDEFGKGTGPTDGAGLLTALLGHFQALKDDMPRILAATHFHEVFENGFVQPGPSIGLAHMDVRLELSTGPTDDQVTFLYKLRNGRNSSSYGSWCARVNGVDTDVVDRAEAIVLLLARNEDLELVSAVLPEDEASKLEESEQVARRFLGYRDDEDEVSMRDILHSIISS